MCLELSIMEFIPDHSLDMQFAKAQTKKNLTAENMSSSHLVWFLLFDSKTGESCKGTTAAKIEVSVSHEIRDTPE